MRRKKALKAVVQEQVSILVISRSLRNKKRLAASLEDQQRKDS
jgi:hypothetical protein